MKKVLAVGVDVGATKILAGLVAPAGKVRRRIKARVPVGARPEEIVALIGDAVAALIEDSAAGGRKAKAIGLGVPGIVDASGARVITAPNIALSGVPLAKLLRKRFKKPVVLGNDVNVGLLGEMRFGCARGAADVVGLFPGTGIGGAMIVNGEPLVGAHGGAAELGHMIAEAGGPKCGCGNRGCLEALAGRTAIQRDIRAALRRGERSIVTELTGGDLRVIRSKVLKKALKRKDRVVTRVLAGAADYLGDAALTLRHIFDPELFVFGGGLIEACGEFILPVVRKSINDDPFFRSLGPCKVLPSSLGDDAVLLGAAVLQRPRPC